MRPLKAAGGALEGVRPWPRNQKLALPSSIHLALDSAHFVQSSPHQRRISSDHLVTGLLRSRKPCGDHCSTFFVQRSSDLLAQWPAHIHFRRRCSQTHSVILKESIFSLDSRVTRLIQSTYGSLRTASGKLSSEPSEESPLTTFNSSVTTSK